MKIAAIDIGSNAVRLQIARMNDGTFSEPFKRIEFVRVPIRLGDDAFKQGKITKEKRKEFYKAMQAFSLLLEVFDVKHCRACATSALRDASNSKKILNHVKEETGINIEVISGKQESQIILRSIRHLFKPQAKYLTIDVGGGSTEMTVINNQDEYDSVSFDVGTVRLLDDAIKKETWKEMEKYIQLHLKDVENTIAIATSGTINKIGQLLSPSDVPALTREQLKKFYHTIKKMNTRERIETYRLNPDRADVIEHSAYIYLQILKWANIEQILAPSAGLKDGILYDMYDRIIEGTLQ
jgi:exopolyphosphatase/guanosine-5'-triphosphate,3'-diphosphate pyrophosphatase